jgi:hypothetical protein
MDGGYSRELLLSVRHHLEFTKADAGMSEPSKLRTANRDVVAVEDAAGTMSEVEASEDGHEDGFALNASADEFVPAVAAPLTNTFNTDAAVFSPALIPPSFDPAAAEFLLAASLSVAPPQAMWRMWPNFGEPRPSRAPTQEPCYPGALPYVKQVQKSGKNKLSSNSELDNHESETTSAGDETPDVGEDKRDQKFLLERLRRAARPLR